MKLKRAYPHNFPIPSYATAGAAGIDLYSTEQVTIWSHTSAWIPTGWCFAIPPGFVGLVRDRSGIAPTFKNGLTVDAGVIDPDYRGEVKVLLYNKSSGIQVIEPEMRIAQLVLVACAQHDLEEVDELNLTVRGNAGFGSTGV